MSQTNSQSNKDRSTWIGVCLLVIGLIYANRYYHWDWFGINFNLPPGMHLNLPFDIFSWPAILVVVGLCLLVVGRGVGTLLILIGGFFLFTSEFIWLVTHIHEWWPVALIIVGILILTKSTSAKQVQN